MICHYANAQEKDENEKREKKVEIKKKITDDGVSILLRIEKADGSIFEKTYASEEEMKNDPELKELDINFGDTEDFLFRTGEDQDGKFEVIVKGDEGDRSKRVLMFNSEEGATREFKDGDVEWIDEFEEGIDHFNYFLPKRWRKYIQNFKR